MRFSHALLLIATLAPTSLLAQGNMGQELQQMRQQMMQMQQRIQYLEGLQSKQNAAINHVNLKTEKASALRVDDVVSLAPEYSDMLFSWQNDVSGKPLETLKYRQNGVLDTGNVYWSGVLKGSLMAESTNTENKFAILSRFPSQHSGNSGSRFVFNNVGLATTAAIHDWVTATLLFDYSETEYSSNEQFDMRKAYLTVGNLDKSPFYAMFGRNTVDFGNNDSFNPFTHTMNNHYFRVESDAPVLGVGYADHGTHIIATAINGGRQQRVANHPSSNHVKNFAVNATQEIELGGETLLKVGGGYLHSTIYDSVTPHHTASGIVAGEERTRNGAFNLNAELDIVNLVLMAEFTQTLDEWNATDHKVSALTVQGEYFFKNWGRPASLSAVYSRGVQGASGTEWERMEQAVLGYETEVDDHFYLGAEYVYNKGFVPLLNILTTSDRDVENHSVVMGGRYIF